MYKNNLKTNFKIIFIALVIMFLTGFKPGPGSDDDLYAKINENMDVFGRVYKEVALNYVDEVDVEKFMRAGIEGMLNTLDPYTNFVDVTHKGEVDLLTTGKYGGIGITIGLIDSAVVITDIMEGYSAEREGLKRGDKIIEIESTPITGQKINDIRALVRGTTGTTFKMKVNRKGQELEFTLTRQDIQLKNITFKGVIGNGVGYIKLDRFNRYAENEMIDALTEIKNNGGTNGIILDLRDNPGGLLDAAIGILNKFVGKGSLLLSTKGRTPDSEREFHSTETPLISLDEPVVVLVNQNSASASEIVAGAIQDLDRGVILGTKSFGKGLVQIYAPLSYGNELRITNQKYFTPSGRWIQSKNYFKENKYGVFKPIPYLNQSAFKTLKGRTVYAEGGITPDTTVSVTDYNELLDKLIQQDAYFKFAEKYVNDHPDGSAFTMSDDIIQSFYEYINDPVFEFKLNAENELDNLKLLVSKNYSDKAKSLTDELENELKNERLRNFEASRPVIRHMLEVEIMKKYNKSDQDVKLAELKEDNQVQAAIGLIGNKTAYNSLLSPK